MSQKIEFIKFERKCPHNDSVRAKGDTRLLIRDFKVIIDGEHRATLSRESMSRSYSLYDPHHHAIKGRDDWRGAVHFASQATFLRGIVELLQQDRIPTLAEAAFDLLRDAAVIDNKRFDANLENIRRAREKFSFDLQEIVRLVAHADGPVLEQSLVRRAQKTLDMIIAQTAQWDKGGEETG